MKKVLLISIFIGIFLVNFNTDRKIILKNQEKSVNLIDKIDYYSKKHGIKPIIFQELLRKESNFNPDAVGDQGEALGIAQIQSKYWYKYCLLTKNEFLDVDLALNCSAKILKSLLKKYNGNYFNALKYYNGGYSNSKASKKYATLILTKAKKLEKYS